ncbi:MAG: ATP-grasp domain-containing protein [Parvibaculum sp.]
MQVDAAPFDPQAPALSSRYIQDVVSLPPYRGEGDLWLAVLEQHLATRTYDLLIPCCDRSILALNHHRARFAGQCLAVPDVHAIPILFDKLAVKELAGNVGVPVAAGRSLFAQDNVETLVQAFGLPLLVKPRASYKLDQMDTRGKVVVARNVDEITEALGDVHRPSEFMVEEYFEGYGGGLSTLSHKGEVLLAFQHRRLKEPRTGGGSSLRESVAVDPVMLAACARILHALDYTGVCMFEFRQAHDRADWILVEINARFWGSLPLPVSLGVDFPFQLLEMMTGETVGAQPTYAQPPYTVGVKGRNMLIGAYDTLFKDRKSVGSLVPLMRDLGGLALHPFKLLIGSETSDVWVGDDLKPAFAEIFSLPRVVRARSGAVGAVLPSSKIVADTAMKR